MRIASLGSGSRGNATLVEAAERLLLIDAGFSAREIERRMRLLHREPGELAAILVTHEHGDHIAGVEQLARRYGLPVYATHGTIRRGGLSAATLSPIDCHRPFRIDGVEVTPVPVPHDASEPCQYIIGEQGTRFGVLTDLGHITPHVLGSYRGCAGLLLEFNHDLAMLQSGPYPPALKRRVGSDHGHLNNAQAIGMLRATDLATLRHLVVGHVSEVNNRPDLVAGLLEDALGSWSGRIVHADQDAGCAWQELT